MNESIICELRKRLKILLLFALLFLPNLQMIMHLSVFFDFIFDSISLIETGKNRVSSLFHIIYMSTYIMYSSFRNRPARTSWMSDWLFDVIITTEIWGSVKAIFQFFTQLNISAYNIVSCYCSNTIAFHPFSFFFFLSCCSLPISATVCISFLYNQSVLGWRF